MRLAHRWAVGLLLGGVAIAGVDVARPLSAGWFTPQEHRRVVDRDGVVIAERPVPDRGKELWVELDEVSPAVIDALLAAEDDRFWHHRGLDVRAIGRAILENAKARGIVEGASTLTQQTARILSGPRRTPLGKIAEAWRALKLEVHLDKEEILTWYLNRAYFGRGAYGIEAAARVTFDETAGSLSVSEAATLIGTLPAPSRRHPAVDLDAARSGRDRVIRRMVDTDRLSATDAALALAEPLQLRSRRAEGLAPHLVARLLDQEPGGGGALITTLDAGLQRDVEALVGRRISALAGREVDHAAVVVVHVPTSEVRAIVGSADFSAPDGQVDGTRALRSPGSALKPFVYGLAFEAGWRPADVIDDAPRRYQTRHGSWAPVNYDGGFRGPVRLREALAGSYNIPAVVLLEEVGVATFKTRLQAIGFDLPDPASHYGLGLALGDAGVTLEALTAAYAGLARRGSWRPLRVAAADPDPPAVAFLDPDAAFVVLDILADPVARLPSFGRRNVLTRTPAAAVKTGTSTDFRDNWTVGVTDTWAVGVWVGNFDGRPMGDVSGITGAGPLWAAVMNRVASDGIDRRPPPGWRRLTTCTRSGGSATPACPHTSEDHVGPDADPRPLCTIHGGAPDAAGAAIDYPVSGTRIYIDPRVPPAAQRVGLRATVPAGATSVIWRADGVQVASGPQGLWIPDRVGSWRVSLEVDGRQVDEVDVRVQGDGVEAPRRAPEDTPR